MVEIRKVCNLCVCKRTAGKRVTPGASEVGSNCPTTVCLGGEIGVRVILKQEYVKSVVEVKSVLERVTSMKLQTEGVMTTVVSTFARQVGYEVEEKEEFWSELDEVVESVPWEEEEW